MMIWLLEKRWRIILSGTLIVTAPIICLALFVYIEISGHLRDIIDEENRQAALNIATHINENLQGDIRNGGLFTTRLLLKEAVRQRDRIKITRHLRNFVDHVSSVERALVADRKGILLANYSEDPALIGKSFSDRDWYKGVSRNWEPYVSEFYLRAGRPQKYLFAIALPIKDADNSVIGALVLQASENYIQDAISHIPSPKNQKVYVVDKKGNLIYHPDYRVDRIVDFTGFPSVRNVINGQSGVETLKNADGAAMLTAYRPVNQWGWGVIVQRPEQEVYASLRKLTYGLFAFTAVMIAIGASLAYRRSEALFSLKKLSRELETRVEERTAELTKTNRVLKTLSECNQALVRIEDEDVLIKKLCRIITEYGGYRMALVGYSVQDENKTVKAVAQAGYEDDFLDSVSLTWADTEAGNGPIGTAIRSRDISLFKNIASDAYPAVWREAALRRGYGSAIGLPLAAGKELMGALAIYSSDAFAFDEKEIKLLKELADDMAYGIMTIRSRAAHKAAEDALHRSQELYHSTLDNMMEGCQIIGTDWRYLYINDAAEKHNRRPREELQGRIMMDMWPGIEATEVFAAERRCMEERTAHHMENEFVFPDGASGWFDLSIQPVPDGIFILSIDITERKQAEQKIKYLAESLSELIYSADPDTLAATYVNSAVERFYGYTAEEWLKDPDLWSESIHPDDRERTMAAFAELQRLKENRVIPYRVKRKDGTVRWVEDSVSFEKNRQGKAISMNGVIHDITDRKLAEEALRESEEKYRKLADNSLVGIYKTSLSGNIVYANKAAAKLFEFDSPEEMMAEGVLKRYKNPEERERLIEMLRNSGRVEQIEFELLTRTGKSKTIIMSAVMDGNSISGMLIDNTERKKNDLFIKNIFESMGEGLVVVDPQYRIVAANKEYCRQVDLRIEEIVGRHCHEISHHIDKQCAELGIECPPYLTFQSGGPHAAVHELKGEKGAPTYHEIKSYPIKDESGEVRSVIEIITDITEKRKLETQYIHAQKMESVGTLAGGIAHDFNNILSAIIGYGHVALMKMAEDDPQRLNIENILEAADRAAHLTKDLLLFSRKQVSERRPVDLNEVVRKVEKFLKRVIGEDIECRTMMQDRPIPVLADSHQLEQVLMNFATNSRDAMPEGGAFTVMTEQINLNEDFTKAHGYGMPGPYAMITVSDTGIGMDEAARKRIFEPFFTTKEVGKGTGLGLAVVYGIIKQHDGFINVYSEPGKGTTFRIYLPLIASEAREETAARPEEAPARGTETVLLAEDDANLRKLTQTLLEEFGYTVITANDGEEAVAKFRENGDDIQLLLFDLIMPKRNGKEACDEIRKIKPDIKAVFTSGYAPDIIRQKASLKDGANLIYKPVSPMELLRKVRSVLDGTSK